VVLITIGLVTVSLSLRRLVYRMLIYRRFERGVGTRNVLIVGTGPEAHALRHHWRASATWATPSRASSISRAGSRFTATSGDVVGTLDTLFQHARKQFVDEIFFTTPASAVLCRTCWSRPASRRGSARGPRHVRRPGLEQPHRVHRPVSDHSAALRACAGDRPGASSGSWTFSSPRFRCCFLSPVLLAVAIAVKLDSRGPIFYFSERIGKKGRVFRCIKFRTMVRDAEKRRADVMHMNERDGVLFKISNDPRITKLGRFLRKYSLDELPQFFNVLRGDMSIVGPAPAAGQRGAEYKLSHLRRLDVMPGDHRPVAGAGAPGSLVRQLHLAGCDLHRELEHLARPEDHWPAPSAWCFAGTGS
jgi:hypothetical protein